MIVAHSLNLCYLRWLKMKHSPIYMYMYVYRRYKLVKIKTIQEPTKAIYIKNT